MNKVERSLFADIAECLTMWLNFYLRAEDTKREELAALLMRIRRELEK